MTEQVVISPRNNKISEYNLRKINITEKEEANKFRISDAERNLIKKTRTWKLILKKMPNKRLYTKKNNRLN